MIYFLAGVALCTLINTGSLVGWIIFLNRSHNRTEKIVSRSEQVVARSEDLTARAERLRNDGRTRRG